jgi:hypothetical protein
LSAILKSNQAKTEVFHRPFHFNPFAAYASLLMFGCDVAGLKLGAFGTLRCLRCILAAAGYISNEKTEARGKACKSKKHAEVTIDFEAATVTRREKVDSQHSTV